MVNDILLNDDGDLAVNQQGDLVVGYSDTAHIADILESEPGHYKQHPLVGAALHRYINAPLSPLQARALKRAIGIQLEYDGVDNVEVHFDNNGQLEVNGDYNL